MEAVILDLDASEVSAKPMVELVSQLRATDEDLVLIVLTRSLSKVWRRKLLAAGITQCFVAPIDFAEVQEFLQSALEQRRRQIEGRIVHQDALSRYCADA